ncbi:MAG: tRNA lysidine(34) synthetase TilS [bacterium]
MVIGCSGGIDSIVLAHAAIREVAELSASGFWKEDNPVIILWHLRHGIREEDAEDAEFVAEQATRWGVSAVIESADVPSSRVPGSDSIESVARRIRYARLERFMQSAGKCIAITAHHADDNAETILFNLVRGTGPAGLRGISPQLSNGIHRPLLTVNSGDIMAYASEQELSWRDDPSNTDRSFSRNFLRHEVMPLLASINPAYVEHINRLATYATDLLATAAMMEFQVVETADIFHALPLLQRTAARLGLVKFSDTEPESLTTTCIASALRRIGSNPDYQLISEVHGSLCGTCESVHHGNWHFHFPCNTSGLMYFECLDPGEDPVPTDMLVELKQVSLNAAARQELVSQARSQLHIGQQQDPALKDWWEWLPSLLHAENSGKSEWHAVLPCPDAGMYRFRTRRPGDRITLPNGSTRKVGDVFTDLKVPEFLRDCWALLVDSADEIVWIPALADSRRMHELSESGEYLLASIRPVE